MKVCGHYHNNLSWFLDAANTDELGIKGSRTKIPIRQTPSSELDAKRILPLLADNCFDHCHEEMFPSLLPIRITHSGAVDDRPIREDRVLFVTAACPVENKHAKLTVRIFGNNANVFSIVVFDGPILDARQS